MAHRGLRIALRAGDARTHHLELAAAIAVFGVDQRRRTVDVARRSVVVVLQQRIVGQQQQAVGSERRCAGPLPFGDLACRRLGGSVILGIAVDARKRQSQTVALRQVIRRHAVQRQRVTAACVCVQFEAVLRAAERFQQALAHRRGQRLGVHAGAGSGEQFARIGAAARELHWIGCGEGVDQQLRHLLGGVALEQRLLVLAPKLHAESGGHQQECTRRERRPAVASQPAAQPVAAARTQCGQRAVLQPALQLVGQCVRVFVAPRRFGRQRARQQRLQLCAARTRERQFGKGPAQRRRRVGCAVARAPDERPQQADAQRVDVGAGIEPAEIALLFRRHVAGRAGMRRRHVGADRPRNAEVDHLRPRPADILDHQHIGRLQVAVDDAAPVRVADRAAERDHQFDAHPQRRHGLPPPVVQAQALDPFHHEPGHAVRLAAGVQDLRDAGVRQQRQSLTLDLEARAGGAIRERLLH